MDTLGQWAYEHCGLFNSVFGETIDDWFMVCSWYYRFWFGTDVDNPVAVHEFYF